MDSNLWLLKLRLVLAELNTIPDSALHALVMREAQTASQLARNTASPLLIFPCLFEERVGAAIEHEQRSFGNYWRDFGVPAQLAPRFSAQPRTPALLETCYVSAAGRSPLLER
jgi:hypothetical protein